MAEIIRPMPTADSRNSTTPRYRAPILPRRGMSNHSTAMTMIRLASIRPITIPGIDLPIRIWVGCSGVTSNWSKVPASRSRAIDSAVTTRVTTSSNRPTMPGTMNQREVMFSLYQARTSSMAGRGGPPLACCCARLKSINMLRRYPSAIRALLELRPSSRACSGALRPWLMLRLKSWPTLSTSSTSRLSISGRSSCSCVTWRTMWKAGEPSIRASSSREWLPWSWLYTATGTSFRSKVAA